MRPPPCICIWFASWLLVFGAGDCCRANVIQDENALPGTASWQLTNPATVREIEGYASATSVNKGGQIGLLVSSGDPNFNLEIYRMGWYGSAGARQVLGPIQVAGGRQPTPVPDPVTGLAECNWSTSYLLNVPTTWVSGVYLAKLTAVPSGKQAFIIFVVRDDARNAPFLFQCSVTTYHAYNNWPGNAGGRSLYNFNSANSVPAVKVSFNRPYSFDAGQGAGHFLSGPWEYNTLRFMEHEGYDVSYCTNIDVHQNANLISSHRAFLSVGHDEYWSWNMRANVTAARDHGINLGFFGANTCYWQIRLEPSLVNGVPDRVQVGYKQAVASDPYTLDSDPTNDKYITSQWRQNSGSPPEEELVGVEYVTDPVSSDIVISDPTHWAVAGTGAVAGQLLPGLLGYEVDGVLQPTFRPGVSIFAHSPIPGFSGPYTFSDMTTYVAPSGATVFATGSIWWALGLDDWGAPSIHPLKINTVAQQITRNLLNRLGPAPTPGGGGPTGPSAITNGSFESALTGWTPTGNLSVGTMTSPPGTLTATDGVKTVTFNDGNRAPNGVLKQTFATIPGATYNLAFDVGVTGWQTTLEERLQVLVQGSGTLLSQTVSVFGKGTTTAWTSKSYSFVANTAATTLTFTDV